jgi:hypothetical protein
MPAFFHLPLIFIIPKGDERGARDKIGTVGHGPNVSNGSRNGSCSSALRRTHGLTVVREVEWSANSSGIRKNSSAGLLYIHQRRGAISRILVCVPHLWTSKKGTYKHG